jgi:hypothetical protein
LAKLPMTRPTINVHNMCNIVLPSYAAAQRSRHPSRELYSNGRVVKNHGCTKDESDGTLAGGGPKVHILDQRR